MDVSTHIYCLGERQHALLSIPATSTAFTFPPRTSSPMMRHAAVWTVRELRSFADAILAKVGAIDEGEGRGKCLAAWDSLDSMDPDTV